MPLSLSKFLPDLKSASLAIAAAILLMLAFPDFEWWFTAWFALVPLMWAVDREKGSVVRSFVTGWLFGTIFFFGTCWWLTYAPIHYAGFPWWLAYSGMIFVALIVGVFPALFAGILAVLLRKLGSWAFLAAPFVWVFTEFLRYWVTGNNWNAVGYSQFLGGLSGWASIGGVLSVSFAVVIYNLVANGLVLICIDVVSALAKKANGITEPNETSPHEVEQSMFKPLNNGSDDDLNPFFMIAALAVFVIIAWITSPVYYNTESIKSTVIAIQPNVPMSGLDLQKWQQLRQRQVDLAEGEIMKLKRTDARDLVILPESPMNFMYEDDREFQKFINDFARRNNVSVLFNSAEPDATNGKYFNSAVMVGPEGREVGQYDKIFLLPFGEAVPSFLDGIVPAFVGTFSYGSEYDILPVGDAKAGVMICFESHFGQLSREYVRNGADVIIEMTNDGYLGPTPVLRQHLANAVFRAVETNRPVLRVTNVGITAYINERGQVLDEAPSYQEATRVWSVSKSDGSQTFYVRYGDWFAWLCSVVTIGLLGLSIRKRRAETRVSTSVPV
ncbi:MAG: apolipoprotein N-acyltransferase [Pyrinomonadaceae bacterium]|nr:apolipoprotein N-acyltransferase [Pyrinomonadaceae bacterium]